VAKGYQGMGEQVNLLVQPRQPLSGILDFGRAGVGIFAGSIIPAVAFT